MTDSVPVNFHVQENGQIRTLSFTKPVIKVGKLPSSDVLLDVESVTRLHAVIEVDPAGEIYLIDLGSAHGTRVNGKPISKCRLRTGDELQFGSAKVSVQFGEPYDEQKMQFQLQKAFDDAEVLLRKKYPDMEASISLGGVEPPSLGIGPQGLYFQPFFSDDMLPLAKAGVPMASMLSCAEALPKLIDALEAQARQKAEALNRVAANAARVNSALDAIQSAVKVLGE